MSIESALKKDGITVVGKLDTLSSNTISRNIAEKLCKAFPNQNFIFLSCNICLQTMFKIYNFVTTKVIKNNLK